MPGSEPGSTDQGLMGGSGWHSSAGRARSSGLAWGVLPTASIRRLFLASEVLGAVHLGRRLAACAPRLLGKLPMAVPQWGLLMLGLGDRMLCRPLRNLAWGFSGEAGLACTAPMSPCELCSARSAQGHRRLGLAGAGREMLTHGTAGVPCNAGRASAGHVCPAGSLLPCSMNLESGQANPATLIGYGEGDGFGQPAQGRHLSRGAEAAHGAGSTGGR